MIRLARSWWGPSQLSFNRNYVVASVHLRVPSDPLVTFKVSVRPRKGDNDPSRRGDHCVPNLVRHDKVAYYIYGSYAFVPVATAGPKNSDAIHLAKELAILLLGLSAAARSGSPGHSLVGRDRM